MHPAFSGVRFTFTGFFPCFRLKKSKTEPVSCKTGVTFFSVQACFHDDIFIIAQI
jgi:hypothetical protein